MNPEIPPAARRVKVDTGAYGQPGLQWLDIYEVLGGDAARPVRVRMPDGEIREFSVEEIESWRD